VALRQMSRSFYVELLMAEWGMENCSPRLQACMRRVLGELGIEAQITLRNNPKLQVIVLPEAVHNVWACFPAHRKRWVVRHFKIKLKPTARVLLLVGENRIEQQSARMNNINLRDHLGHVLLYLRFPKARNECTDALREWEECSNRKS
jgi:hypothetical protein